MFDFESYFGAAEAGDDANVSQSQDADADALALQPFGLCFGLSADRMKDSEDQVPLSFFPEREAGKPLLSGGSEPLAVGNRIDGSEVHAAADFSAIQQAEVGRLLSIIETSTRKELAQRYSLPKASTGVFCPLCPRVWLRSQWKSGLRQHLERHHLTKPPSRGRIVGGKRLGSHNLCCSGSKQLRVASTLFDHDRMRRSVRDNYLAESATLLR